MSRVLMEASHKRDMSLERLSDVEVPDALAERDWRSTEPILGSCPDMCPEAERLERERKGDLDRFERLDGDRNQTSRNLAVKKYTRTAEKEPDLIRPLPVLSMTMEHLLNLLNRSYDDKLLTVHNFLWDRMRAIRMDLRMQHIFNLNAIALHEQMIRFHILAMHELCEFAKGKGLSEGFDAHLNIEQMNKASVDLFQMYDDFRKQGLPVASEAEFRGYYALLKLDKHPGYVVEPAELSLDLAKMTPEMRNSPEVQFAREVARACRAGNYLAFFRLARRATYLQACLMHAHFSKLRTQALASLNSALQKNQGIPIVQVEEWLAMEGEDIEALVLYHGFSLKNYEEPYIVKEGQFMNRNRDFQTRRAKLVEEKRSLKVVDDVLSSGQAKVMSSTGPVLDRVASLRRQSDIFTVQAPASLPEEEMPDYEEEEQPPEDTKNDEDWLMLEEEMPYEEEEIEQPSIPLVEVTDSYEDNAVGMQVQHMRHDVDRSWQDGGLRSKRRKSAHLWVDPETHHDKELFEQGVGLGDFNRQAGAVEEVARMEPLAVEKDAEDSSIAEAKHEEEENRLALHRVEANIGKLRCLLRRWKFRATLKAEERHWCQEKAETALSSLYLGLPVHRNHMGSFMRNHIQNNSADSTMQLNLSWIKNRRFDKFQKTWASLDVATVVAPILKQKNPAGRFICWKLLLCSGVQNKPLAFGGKSGKFDKAGEWILEKLMAKGHNEIKSAGGLQATPDTVMWQEVVCMPGHDDDHQVQFSFIARDIRYQEDKLEDRGASQGSSGLLFLIKEGSSLIEEHARLLALISTIPAGADLPLLILFTRLSESMGYCNGRESLKTGHMRLSEAEYLERCLHLKSLDRSRVACWLILSIANGQELCSEVSLDNGQFRGLVDVLEEGGSHIARDDEVKGFYSEDSLKQGLIWLASNTPFQPHLRRVHVWDLVLEYLNPEFVKLLRVPPSDLNSNSYVSIFNEALQRTVDDISCTAHNSLPFWPPFELSTMKNQGLVADELLADLPEIGWNEVKNLQPVIEVLTFCQLPPFPNVPINQASVGSSLKRQKEELEQTLLQYVNQISGIQHDGILTLKIVDSILQRGCSFNWKSSGIRLIPNWAYIFQRIYHLRLSLLNNEPYPFVYVSPKENAYLQVDEWRSPSLHQSLLLNCDYSQGAILSLDEMIEMESQGLTSARRHPVAFQKASKVTYSSQNVLNNFNVLDSSGLRPDNNFDILQLSLKRDGRDLAVLEDLVEFPVTHQEIELDNIVTEFCKKVDQQLADTVRLEDRDSLMKSVSQDIGNAGNSVHLVMYDNSSFSPPQSACNDMEANFHSVDPPCWATSDGMESLNKLLNQCDIVQASIDDKLVDYFRVEAT